MSIQSPEAQRQVHLAMANIQVELGKLTNKRSLSKQEARRFDMLLQRASNLKAGFPLAEVLQSEANARFAEQGLEEVRFHSSAFESRSAEDREDSRQIREWLKTGKIEKRTETVGVANFVYFSGNAGSLVPTRFLNKIVRTMAQHSPLFDPENVTYIDSENGDPLQAPYFSDVENVATVIGEAVDDSGTGTNINSVGGTHIVTYNYRTPRILFSYETDQDVPQLDELLGAVLSDRFARGAGLDLLYGNGTNKMLGLIPSLQAVGVNPTIA
jgi:HK97 family phage major capsid protein